MCVWYKQFRQDSVVGTIHDRPDEKQGYIHNATKHLNSINPSRPISQPCTSYRIYIYQHTIRYHFIIPFHVRTGPESCV